VALGPKPPKSTIGTPGNNGDQADTPTAPARPRWRKGEKTLPGQRGSVVWQDSSRLPWTPAGEAGRGGKQEGARGLCTG
jgi:hypothetical protein